MTRTNFPIPIETVRGSHYEMGLQHGRIYRHVVIGNVRAWAMRHDFQGSDEELDEGLEAVRAGDETFAPWVFEELRGIAEGSGVPLPWIVRMHLRVWNRVPRKDLAPGSSGGCTGIGMIAEQEGVIVGGTLDDPRQSDVLIRRIPRDGIPHVQVAWAGTGWGHNGINAAGLCIAESSLGACTPPLKLDESKPQLRGSMSGRILLERCEDVPQALALLKRLQPTDSLVLGDAKGNLVACQCLGEFHQSFQSPNENANFVFNTNHVHMPDLVAKIVAAGCVPKVTEYSMTRFATLERARASMPRSLETMLRLLRSHDGYPHSICNDGNVTTTYAMPQTQPAVLFLADCPPCRSEFCRYAVAAEG